MKITLYSRQQRLVFERGVSDGRLEAGAYAATDRTLREIVLARRRMGTWFGRMGEDLYVRGFRVGWRAFVAELEQQKRKAKPALHLLAP